MSRPITIEVRSRSRLTRSSFLRRTAAVSGVAFVGAASVARSPPPARSATSPARDEETLAYLLELEDLQAAFYAEALDRDALAGEVEEYAQVVGGHEREHVDYLRGALGAKAAKPATFDFGDTTSDSELFLATAVAIEETGLAAYTGAAVNLSADALRDATRLVSVEARHAAWARDLLGRNPAPDASDEPAPEAEVRAAIAKTGFVRGR